MLFITFSFLLGLAAADLPHPFSDEYIELINSKQNSWVAGRNYAEYTSLEDLTARLGAFRHRRSLLKKKNIKTYDADLIVSLPESFDPRDKWPNCPSLKEIRDQGPCDAGWALGTVAAMTDRWCIHSNGSQFHFSADDMVGCAYGFYVCSHGYPDMAWDFWNSTGVVSGGNYRSDEGCLPYSLPECIHGNLPNSNCSGGLDVVACLQRCQEGYGKSYKYDKRFGQEAYFVDSEKHIQFDLYLNGPPTLTFPACPDLFHYKKGVYRCTYHNISECADHTVKLMGWGIEDGTKYWLLANSWNTYWGELGGFFKFVRGENHLEIEESHIAALPKLH